MNEVIVAPNAEAALVTWGNAINAARALSAPVATRHPKTKQNQWVRMYLVGGRRTSLVTRQQRFVWDFYALTETKAHDLGQIFLAEFLAINRLGSIQCYTPEIASDLSNLPDPAYTDRARYSATTAVGIRAHAV